MRVGAVLHDPCRVPRSPDGGTLRRAGKLGRVPARVLIIEDDPDVREALADALVEAGVRVAVAVDGLDGLEQLAASPLPAVILLDMRMPRLGGEAFLRTIRADRRYDAVPVISMTAGGEAPDRDEVVAHLQKPFDLDALLDVVLSLCEPLRALPPPAA
jgi:two-component system, chemotaxis family, chemotaxis protein CheY